MKILFFDFDGTIADSKQTYYKSIYDVVKRFGYKYSQIDKVIDFGLTLKATLKKLGFGFFVSVLAKREIMSQVKKHVNEIKKCKDADSIKKIKHKKILISNSLKEFIMPILKHLKLKKDFSEIYGADDFDNKSEFIKNYIKKHKIDKKDCYYIGDRVADIKIAKKAGCKSVIVSGKCAWNSRKEILKAGPDFIIYDLGDLRKLFKRI